MKLLIVEDERRMAEAITETLTKNHYAVDIVYDGDAGLDYALTGIYDIILLDIMLPKRDGVSVLKEIRKNKLETHIIMLTAKGDTEDIISGLDNGADDYLSKPFQMGELLARLRALSRRKGELIQDGILRYEDIELSPNTLNIRKEDQSFKLTQKECQLMEYLMLNRGVILSTNTIIEKIWGWDSEVEDNHVQVYISFLRKKLAQIDSSVGIKNVRNAGYILTAEGGK